MTAYFFFLNKDSRECRLAKFLYNFDWLNLYNELCYNVMIKLQPHAFHPILQSYPSIVALKNRSAVHNELIQIYCCHSDRLHFKLAALSASRYFKPIDI